MKGSVSFQAELVENNDDIFTVKFTGNDTGIGIPGEKLKGIFVPFKPADSSTTRKFGGSGPGLAICRQLADLMEGKVGVDSEPGKGSEFWFTTQFKKHTSKLRAEGLKENHTCYMKENQLKKKKILVAEDNMINQVVVRKILEKEGISVDIVETGAEAIKALEITDYAAVLMDIQMPEMDGYQAISLIREMEKSTGKHLPLIALTASAMEEDREKSFKAGADDFITKPIDKTILMRTIQKHTTVSQQKTWAKRDTPKI
ncbi:hypothetical protein BH23BAC3_BH23BAC3_09160 [soil metagenome]